MTHAGQQVGLPKNGIERDLLLTTVGEPEFATLPPEYQRYAQLAAKCMVHSRADSTMSRYQGHWQRFKRFCQGMNKPCLPANPLHVAWFLAATLEHCVYHGFGFQPIKMASAAVYAAHSLCLGIKSGITDHPFASQVRTAAQKLLGDKAGSKRKDAMPPVLCAKCVHSLLALGSGYALQTATFIMLCFSAYLRYDDSARIRLCDFKFFPSHMEVFVPSRKNDQFRKGHTAHVARGQTAACPVRLAELWVKASLQAGCPRLAPVFRHLIKFSVSKPHLAQVCRSGVWSYPQAKRAVLFELSRTAGMSYKVFSRRYGLHSLRSGGTSWSLARGVSERVVQAHGGWRTEAAMQVYIQRPLGQLLEPTAVMGF